MDSATALQVSNLSFGYGKRLLLDDVNLTVAAGETVAIVGRTGSGKSTLLSCISGMLRPRSGSVHVGGQHVAKLNQSRLAEFRRRSLGFVFQFGELLPTLSPDENVALPALFDGVSWDAASSRARELLVLLGVPDTGAVSATLSGGERQRVALARALINEPDLLIADEPTGSLDAEVRDDVVDLIINRPGAESSALLVVTHDPVLAARMRRAYRLEDGRLMALDQSFGPGRNDHE